MTMIDYRPKNAERRHRTQTDAYTRASSGDAITIAFDGPADDEGPAWVHDVIIQLVKLYPLRDGWNGVGSLAFERGLSSSVLNVLLAVMPPGHDAFAPTLVPTRDGGVQLEWHRGGWDLEVELSPLGGAWVDCERADGTDMWQGRLTESMDPLRVVLKEIADR